MCLQRLVFFPPLLSSKRGARKIILESLKATTLDATHHHKGRCDCAGSSGSFHRGHCRRYSPIIRGNGVQLDPLCWKCKVTCLLGFPWGEWKALVPGLRSGGARASPDTVLLGWADALNGDGYVKWKSWAVKMWDTKRGLLWTKCSMEKQGSSSLWGEGLVVVRMGLQWLIGKVRWLQFYIVCGVVCISHLEQCITLELFG